MEYSKIGMIVQKMIEQIDAGTLKVDLESNYQSNVNRIDIIQSVLMRFPMMPMMMLSDEEGVFHLMDGNTRLQAIYGFVKGKYSLEGMELIPELNGKVFNELDKQFQRRIMETTFDVYTMSDKVEEKYLWAFLRQFNPEGQW